MSALIRLAICSLVFGALGESSKLQCYYPEANVQRDWIHMTPACVQAMLGQIHEEMYASIQFLAMFAHFSRDDVNRLGVAAFYSNCASVERSHAIKLARYLIMRGELTTGVSTVFKLEYMPSKVQWDNVTEALDDSIRVESRLTDSIRRVIDVCENIVYDTDYVLDDWLTGAFLRLDYHNLFEKAGITSSLRKMEAKNEPLGVFMADKQLLERFENEEFTDGIENFF